MVNSETNANLIPEEVVLNKIYFIRNHKVKLDKDLAELYGVETRVLNQAIKRNLERFPDDFMFQLSQEEFNNLISQSVTSSWGGTRKTPYAFTELGVSMLSSVLNSSRAIAVNIQIVSIYYKLRQMMITQQDVLLKLEKIEKKIGKHDKKIQLVFDYLNQFIKQEEEPRERIGFKK